MNMLNQSSNNTKIGPWIYMNIGRRICWTSPAAIFTNQNLVLSYRQRCGLKEQYIQKTNIVFSALLVSSILKYIYSPVYAYTQRAICIYNRNLYSYTANSIRCTDSRFYLCHFLAKSMLLFIDLNLSLRMDIRPPILWVQISTLFPHLQIATVKKKYWPNLSLCVWLRP